MRRTRSSGFTLIELLIVLSIIAIIAAIAIPNLIEASKQSQLKKSPPQVSYAQTKAESFVRQLNYSPSGTACTPDGEFGNYSCAISGSKLESSDLLIGVLKCSGKPNDNTQCVAQSLSINSR